MSTIDEVAEYIGVARIVQITRICQLAPYVVMIYDHILTFDQEVEHIWKSSRSLNTVVYLILRYSGNAFALLTMFAFLAEEHASNDICRVFLFLNGWTGALVLWLIQRKRFTAQDYCISQSILTTVILQMRLYVLYRNSKKILFLTGGAYIAEIVTMSMILGISDVDAYFVNEPAPGIFICADLNAPKIFYSIWLAPVIFESILCLLAIRIGIQRSKDHFRPALMSGTRLVNVVVMGNVMNFVGILLTCIVGAAISLNLGSEWLEVPVGFALAAEVITGCRLILHTRGAVSGGPHDNTISSTQGKVQYRLQRFLPKSDLDEA
ncbi:hypothetical protein HYDPIDRAFT_119340 [Hydnomerulius pinastri MD-312]|uniref:DUF6533 domain-containing protein n=1 Tax=Hydnomerulius pinastri MD-312 TaxID=994086 RepID=A0A0C9V0B7_9AGAM|nr:hypothetical protein HYDPIDRAFT_119340 [Hydnomerulius pinastri MD-312]